MNIFNIFKKKQCKHDKNYRSRTYLLKDGTPMVEFECFVCNWKDHGHVYADSDDYEKNLIIVREGKEVFNQNKKIHDKFSI